MAATMAALYAGAPDALAQTTAMTTGALATTAGLKATSEFGRRVGQNGSDGLDHGYGNAMLMLGGGVRGGKVHGRWPGLAAAQLVDGDLAVTTDYRAVIGEILRARCGISDLAGVFPGVKPSNLGLVAAR
jgi:uncharacterized protein (DUF1501 family)